MTKRRNDGLDYIPVDAPGPGQLVQVAPGVHWARMPLPLALDHINLWLLEDTDPVDGSPTWTVVDTGMSTKLTKETWQTLFDGPAANRKPSQLIATHYHPDHCGLAGWLMETYGLTFKMTESEWMIASLLWRVPDNEYAESQDRFFARYGIADDVRSFHVDKGNAYRQGVGYPPTGFSPLRNSETIEIGGRNWTIITCGGHTTDHACLYCAEIDTLISGDQVLPQISPIISVWWYKDGLSPLPDYLEGLSTLRKLPADTLVLPSHRQPFRGLHFRIDQLSQHHADRLDDLRRGFNENPSMNTMTAIRILFDRELDAMNMLFAAGEAIAHLEHLVRTGEVKKQNSDGDSIQYMATDSMPVLGKQAGTVEDVHF